MIFLIINSGRKISPVWDTTTGRPAKVCLAPFLLAKKMYTKWDCATDDCILSPSTHTCTAMYQKVLQQQNLNTVFMHWTKVMKCLHNALTFSKKGKPAAVKASIQITVTDKNNIQVSWETYKKEKSPLATH